MWVGEDVGKVGCLYCYNSGGVEKIEDKEKRGEFRTREMKETKRMGRYGTRSNMI